MSDFIKGYVFGILHAVLITAVMLSFSGCGKEDQRRQQCTAYGERCHENERTKERTADDNSSVGPQGPAGRNGRDGVSGSSCSVVSVDVGAIITCTDGTASYIYNGEDGQAAENCHVESVVNGAIIHCPTDSALILNGLDGTDGTDAVQSAYSITELIDVCGPSGNFDEIIFRTFSGALIAHYSHGNKQFLTELRPGNYITTDYQQCSFSVNEDLTVTDSTGTVWTSL